MMMDVLTAISERRSVRRYSRQPVSAQVIEQLLTAATWAPSAHNRQPWRFAVLIQSEPKERLAEAMGARLRGDRLADGDALDKVEQDAARSRLRIVNAPVVIVVCLTMADMDKYPDPRRSRAEYLMATQSVAMAAQNLLLAAHAEGLGACWMCAPLFCTDTVRDTLNLPMDWEPQALITLGYSIETGKPAHRRLVRETIAWR